MSSANRPDDAVATCSTSARRHPLRRLVRLRLRADSARGAVDEVHDLFVGPALSRKPSSSGTVHIGLAALNKKPRACHACHGFHGFLRGKGAAVLSEKKNTLGSTDPYTHTLVKK